MSLLLDTQYLEGFVTEEELARCAGPLAAAGEALAAGDGAPKGWRTLPEGFPEPLLRQLADTGRRIRESAEVLLVIGIGGSYLGARAALDFLPKRPGCEVLFLGNSLSPSALAETLARCEGREVAVNVVSKSGTTTEPAIAFRVVLDWLRRRYGSRLRERVWCTTDPSGGALRSLCEEEGFRARFEIPPGHRRTLLGADAGGAAAGGPPAAGDIAALLDGAREGQRRYGGPRLPGKPGGTAGGHRRPAGPQLSGEPVRQLRALCRQPLPVADPALRREPGQGRPGPLPGGGPVHHRPALAGSVHPGGPAGCCGRRCSPSTPAPARR